MTRAPYFSCKVHANRRLRSGIDVNQKQTAAVTEVTARPKDHGPARPATARDDRRRDDAAAIAARVEHAVAAIESDGSRDLVSSQYEPSSLDEAKQGKAATALRVCARPVRYRIARAGQGGERTTRIPCCSRARAKVIAAGRRLQTPRPTDECSSKPPLSTRER